MNAVTPGRRRSVRRTRRRDLRVLVGIAVVLGLGVVVLVTTVDAFRSVPVQPEPPVPVAESAGRAFSPDSWWNTPLPDDTPLNPANDEILEYLRTAPDSSEGCLWFAGADHSPWGQPIYWSEPGDPTYDVSPLVPKELPPELGSLRIPRGATTANNDDASMTIFDVQKGYVVALTRASYDRPSDTWSTGSATVTYLDSNGLHVDTGRSDDPRNRGGHRGNNGATMAVMWHEVRAGAIRHVLKIASGPELANRAVFPMVGSDGAYEGSDPAVPPQGLRLRIRPSVDLDSLGLSEDVLVVARALQEYGVYLGDSSGRTSLKLESTLAEGRGQMWNIRPDALCGLPFTEQYWEVLPEGYYPKR